jgi:hypothetical protein
MVFSTPIKIKDRIKTKNRIRKTNRKSKTKIRKIKIRKINNRIKISNSSRIRMKCPKKMLSNC